MLYIVLGIPGAAASRRDSGIETLPCILAGQSAFETPVLFNAAAFESKLFVEVEASRSVFKGHGKGLVTATVGVVTVSTVVIPTCQRNRLNIVNGQQEQHDM